ncbi:hypothetical protein [Poriferisphaera corsica]|uniref:hypothetical protein n=1 Tax=Poriferisphaera corsica TaxID=2528020 RepID=UPI0011A9EA93|nr:hypothetical protein [Poriferisphaera corsica]
MSKEQMIQAIRNRNRTAKPEYLGHFDEQDLQQYLARLTSIHGRRGRESRWVRNTTSPAVITRIAQ